jgi:hypothetical protein
MRMEPAQVRGDMMPYGLAGVEETFYAAWMNDTYTVWEYLLGAWSHLSIKRNDREPIHDWRHLQQIKNDICGEDREAVELYPATDRVNDGANQYHLWVLPKGKRMAIGSPLRIVMSEKDTLGYAPGAKQRPFQEGLST